MALNKIISGGQTGADMGALLAAEQMGIPVGGWMPKDFRNEIGFHPDYKKRFGMRETKTISYEPRTRLNIRDAELTLLIGNTWSPGSRLTAQYCGHMKKPFITINFPLKPEILKEMITATAYFIDNNNIQVLNVAGNRESRNPGIEAFTKSLLLDILKLTQ